MGYIVKNLKAFRRDKFLTQKELAEKADLSTPTIVSAESGSPVERDTVKKLAEALGITPEQLVK